MQKLTPCLWFDDKAEEAARFYTSIFEDSEVTGITHYGESGAQASGRPKGSVMTVTFRIGGQEFMGLNGGPQFTFSPAVSFIVNCKTQRELDELWAKLSEGGAEERCGWVTDKYGLSWQVMPASLGEMFQQGDTAKSEKVMQAILTMTKLDIAAIEKATR